MCRSTWLPREKQMELDFPGWAWPGRLPVILADPSSKLDTLLWGHRQGQGQGQICFSLYHIGSFLSGPLNCQVFLFFSALSLS